MNFKSKLFLIVLILINIFAFQNCTLKINSANESDMNSWQSSQSSIRGHGNGDPYDGKLYVHFQPGFTCPDENGIINSTFKEKKIEIIDDKFFLTKNECSQQVKTQLSAQDVIEKDGLAQVGDKLFLSVDRSLGDFINNILDPNYFWIEKMDMDGVVWKKFENVNYIIMSGTPFNASNTSI